MNAEEELEEGGQRWGWGAGGNIIRGQFEGEEDDEDEF